MVIVIPFVDLKQCTKGVLYGFIKHEVSATVEQIVLNKQSER